MDRVAMLFQEADTDGNGTLSRAEFQQVSNPPTGINGVERVLVVVSTQSPAVPSIVFLAIRYRT